MRRQQTAQKYTGTLGKLMEVLQCVAQAPDALRFTDILTESGQPRGTLHRQLGHLVEEGLLELDREGRYLPGLRLLELASQSWSRNEFRTIAEPHLRKLHQETGETVHLGVLRDAEVIYLDKVEGQHSVRMYSQIGNASPVYCTGIGKAALSLMPDDELETIVGQLAFKAFTENTHLSAETLLADVRNIRACGYAFDCEEHEPGIRCVAAPISTRDGSVLAGVSVTGPAYRVTSEKLNGWSSVVCATARAITSDMAARLGPRR